MAQNQTSNRTRDPRTFSGTPPVDPDRSRADLLAHLAALGARTDACSHGCTFADTCPICD